MASFFSDVTLKKWRRFRGIRRGYYAFILFMLMVLLALTAELWSSNRGWASLRLTCNSPPLGGGHGAAGGVGARLTGREPAGRSLGGYLFSLVGVRGVNSTPDGKVQGAVHVQGQPGQGGPAFCYGKSCCYALLV